MSRPRVPLRYAKQKWKENKDRQEKMGNRFLLSFEEWYQFWLDHGEDKNLAGVGYGKNSQVLVRIDEKGAYEVGNIQTMTRGVGNKGRPCRSLGRARPQTWIIKDPELHKMYLPYLKAKSQTDFRVREGLAVGNWKLSFAEFVAAWGDLWPLRGRASNDFTMTREDFEKDWDAGNVIIVTRAEQLRRAADYRMLTGRLRGYKSK
jgi:hypothetical protein